MLNTDFFIILGIIFLFLAVLEIGWFCIRWALFWYAEEKELQDVLLAEFEACKAFDGYIEAIETIKEPVNWLRFMNFKHF